MPVSDTGTANLCFETSLFYIDGLVCESPELTGIVIAHLLAEPKEKLLARSGRVVFVSDTALEMGIRDTDGKWPTSLRSLRFLLEANGRTSLARTVPEFMRLPYSAFNQLGSKF
ncbi:unnamed protein product [Dibothriocephalus latus]|uniref:Uncharacterized protein n=1 Tax=Dibothriocephalus latus TaxID=60516 RepID=A0A3P6PQN0_DIBLA|nr:unnamed protein product [Dibothriocephalus latus]